MKCMLMGFLEEDWAVLHASGVPTNRRYLQHELLLPICSIACNDNGEGGASCWTRGILVSCDGSITSRIFVKCRLDCHGVHTRSLFCILRQCNNHDMGFGDRFLAMVP